MKKLVITLTYGYSGILPSSSGTFRVISVSVTFTNEWELNPSIPIREQIAQHLEELGSQCKTHFDSAEAWESTPCDALNVARSLLGVITHSMLVIDNE